MKKVIILRKIQMTVKSFAPPFFNHFSLSMNKKTGVVMRTMTKKLKTFSHLSCQFITYQNRKSRQVQMPTLQKRSEIHILYLLQRGECLLLRLKFQLV